MEQDVRRHFDIFMIYSWDEWVNHSRMFKDDEEGNKKKAEVERIV